MTTTHNIKRYPLYRAIKGTDNNLYIDAIGCTVGDLKYHLQRQFQDGMRLDNYGAWIVARILTASSINPTDARKSLKYNHWSNLRPAWPEDTQYNQRAPDNHADYDTIRNVSPYDTEIDAHGVATTKGA